MEIPLNIGYPQPATDVVAATRLQFSPVTPSGDFIGSTVTVPGTIASLGTFTSPLLPSGGCGHLALGVNLSNAGTVLVHRYLDNAGSVEIGAALTLALTGGTLAVLDNNDGKAFASEKVVIINGVASVGTLAAFAMLIQNG